MTDTRSTPPAQAQLHDAHAFFAAAPAGRPGSVGAFPRDDDDHTEAEPAGEAPPAASAPVTEAARAGGIRILELVKADVPDALASRRKELEDQLLALVGIAAEYVDRRAERAGAPSLRYGPALWESALVALPLMGPASVERRTLNREEPGPTLPDDLLPPQLGPDATALRPASAFLGFLARQQDAIRAGQARSPDGFTVVLVRMMVTHDARVGAGAGLTARLEATFCGYTARECARPAMPTKLVPPRTGFTAELRTLTRLFNADALRDPAALERWNQLLRSAPRQDVRQSADFAEFVLPAAG